MQIGRSARAVLWSLAVLTATTSACIAGRRFTVADDISFSHFGVPNTWEDEFLFSPNGRYFVVHTERGRVDINRPESTLRIYRSEDVHWFLVHPEQTTGPSLVWEITRSSYKYGPIITRVKWLEDSGGIAFLAKSEFGNEQLVFADLATKTIRDMTPPDREVTGFDVRSRNSFVYSLRSLLVRDKLAAQSRVTSTVGTGQKLINLIFNDDTLLSKSHDRSDLWAIVKGRRFRVRDPISGRPIPLYQTGQSALALSPNGRFVVTALAVDVVPPEWEKLYPPPPLPSTVRIRAAKQDLESIDGQLYVSEYVVIDLSTGQIRPLSRSPLARDAGWLSGVKVGWSADGLSLVVSGMFVSLAEKISAGSSSPCLAVLDLEKDRLSCLEQIDGGTKVGFTSDSYTIKNAKFVAGSSREILVDHFYVTTGTTRSVRYRRSAEGLWTRYSDEKNRSSLNSRIKLSIRQSLNSPPVLVASEIDSAVSRVILDPNPQLKEISLGEVSIFRWKDSGRREQVGALYKPPDYREGVRYPLVIQTHGFTEDEFSPSGAAATAFAAQELAAAGILVLQIRGSEGCSAPLTPPEAECNVDDYETAARQLVSDGIVDSNRVGIIGFSWTCYHVLAALTAGTLQYKAASITDGINAGYFQYIMDVDFPGDTPKHTFDGFIGSPPFGPGLQRWFERSPLFNMEKVTAALLIVAISKPSVLSMWEPYATLRYLKKPVDLVVLTQGQHLLTNPEERIISQGGTVDWFRFWLKGEEDPDPHKAEQYVRWRELRNRQKTNSDHSPD